MTFTATSTATLILFANFDDPSQDFSHIDNVSLIPEPTTALLLTLGLARLGMRRRGR